VKNVAKADLAIAKTPSKTLVGGGQAFSYALAVSNLGTDTASSVLVEDVLPAGLGFVSATGSGWTCTYASATRKLSCTLASLPLSGSTPSVITLNVTAPAGSGTFANTASVSSVTPDTNSANNSASATVSAVSGIDVAITKTAQSASVYAGAPLSYLLKVSNNGVIAATSVTVDDVLPASLAFVSAAGTGWNCVYQSSDRRVTCFLASLAASTSSAITLNVVPSGSAGAVIANSASVSSPDFSDTVPANDSSSTTVTLSAPADLSLSASGSTTGGNSSTQVDTYVLTLVNNGPGTATGIVVSDAMSGGDLSKYAAGCTVVASSGTLSTPSPWSNATLSSGASWAIASLASGASATLTFSCTGDNNKGVTNSASVSSSSYDPNSANNSASAMVIDGTAKNIDLSLSKTVSAATVLTGGTLTYTLTVSNLSTTDNATGIITVTDTLPPGMGYIGYSAGSSGFSCALSASTLTCTTPTNINLSTTGTPNTLSFTVTATAPAVAGVITNTANVHVALPTGAFDPLGNNSASAVTTVHYASTDIAVSKTVDKATPNLGSDVVFTVTASNVGANAASNLRLADLLPATMALVGASPSQGSYDPATGLWYVGSLAAGASAKLLVTATATQSGVQTNQACVYALDQSDSNSANNCASATITPQVADLRVTQTVDSATPGSGTNVTFTVTLSNLGGSAASSITVVDALPDGLQYVSSAVSLGSFDPVSGSWTIPGPLANGASAVLTLVAKVAIAAIPLSNTARVTGSSATDPVLSNNSASVTVTGQASDIEVSKSVDITIPLALNTPLTFTVGVKNNGPTDASSVTVSDLLPSGLVYVSHIAGQGSYSTSTGLWTLGALANGASTSLRVVATNSKFGLLVNTASVLATVPPDPGSTNNVAPVQILSGGAADLAITKSVDKPATFQGDSVNFTVQLQNYGPNPATGVVVKDLLPAGFSYVSNAASQGSYVPASGLWSVGALAVGQRVTLSLRAQVTGFGGLINAASVIALDQADADTSNNTASAAVLAAPAADLAVTLSGSTVASVGAPVSYTLVASNNGPGPSGDASLSATLAAPIAISGWSCVASGDADCDTTTAGTGALGSGNVLSLSHVRIASGSGNRVTVTFTGTAPGPGTATSTVIFSPPSDGSVFDTNTSNNSASVTTVVSNSQITGSVFADTGAGGGISNDGLQNGSEPGLPKVAVRLTDCASTVYGSASTDGAGKFVLAIPAGTAPGAPLCVVQTNLTGYVSTGAQVGNTGGSYDRPSDTIRFPFAANLAYSGLSFGDVPENRFLSDGVKTALGGSTLSFAHTFIAGTGGQVSFSVMAAASPAVSGWTQQLYRNAACDGVLNSAVDTLITAALTVAAGDKLCLVLQEFVPAGLPTGASNLALVQAFFVYSNAVPALTASATRQDLATTGSTALDLRKEVRNLTQSGSWGTSNAARPGEQLEYRLTYSNLAIEPILNLVVRDMTPAFTSYVSGACTLPLPSGLSLCTIVAPPTGATGAIEGQFVGALGSSLSGSVTYRVKVD